MLRVHEGALSRAAPRDQPSGTALTMPFLWGSRHGCLHRTVKSPSRILEPQDANLDHKLDRCVTLGIRGMVRMVRGLWFSTLLSILRMGYPFSER